MREKEFNNSERYYRGQFGVKNYVEFCRETSRGIRTKDDLTDVENL